MTRPRPHLRFDIGADGDEVFFGINRIIGGEADEICDIYLTRDDALFLAQRLIEEVRTMRAAQ